MKTFSKASSSIALAAAILLGAFSAQALVVSETALQNRMIDISSAYNWTCQGAPCYGVWDEQMRANNSLAMMVDDQLTQDQKLSPQSGRLAARAAQAICGATATAHYELLLRLVTSENRVLRRLSLVQKAAGIADRSIVSCNKVIH